MIFYDSESFARGYDDQKLSSAPSLKPNKGICTGGDPPLPIGSKIQDFAGLPEQDLSDADTVTLPQCCNQFAQATQCSLALPDPLFMLLFRYTTLKLTGNSSNH